MTFPRARLVISSCLFLGWISFLLFLILTTPTTILSRPQFLLASLIVVAEVREEHGRPNPRVEITEVLWAADPADRDLAGRNMTISELSVYQKQQGYEGPGKYLLPLQKLGKDEDTECLIAPVPRMDGYVQPSMLGTVEVFGMKDKDHPRQAVSMVGVGSASFQEGPLLVASNYFLRKALYEELVVRMLLDKGAHAENINAIAARLRYPRFAPLVAVRRLPVRKADHLVRDLAELGVDARFLKVDVRIYPLLPETRAQVVELFQGKP